MTSPLTLIGEEAVAWSICPHLRWAVEDHAERPECERCPAAAYYTQVDRLGTKFCRYLADKAARAAISAHLAALLDPRNRTQEMVEAGIVALGSDDDRSSTEIALDVFEAMLRAAAPPATTKVRDMQRSVNKAWLKERMAAPPAQNGDEVKGNG